MVIIEKSFDFKGPDLYDLQRQHFERDTSKLAAQLLRTCHLVLCLEGQ